MRIKLAVAWTLMLLAGLWIGVVWIVPPERSSGPCVIASGPVSLLDVFESSGLAVSRRNTGLLWTHNDSGNDALLFAIDQTGAVRGRVRLPIRTVDWEDVSAARCGSGDCLYIADIGDNRRTRRQLQIYRVPEPLVSDTTTSAPEVFTAYYPDAPHNAEAMFVIDADLFIVTRDGMGGVYRATITPDTRALRFERIGQLSLAAVTDAETSTDGRFVVVRTSHEVVLYRSADMMRRRMVAPLLRIAIDELREPQGEGVALDGNMLYLSSEGRPWNRAGTLVSLRCDLPR